MTRPLRNTILLAGAFGAIAVAGCCSMQDARLSFLEGARAERVSSGESVDFDKVRFTVPEGWAGGKFGDGVVLTPGGKQPETAGAYLIFHKSEETKLFLHDWVRARLEKDLSLGLEVVKKSEGIRRPGGRSMAFMVAEVKRCDKAEYWFYVGVPVAPRTAMPVIYHAASEEEFNKHLIGPSALLETLQLQSELLPPSKTPPPTKTPAGKVPEGKAKKGE
jgi:hypothetical protein